MKRQITYAFLLFISTASLAHADDDLYGVWKPTTYKIDGKDHPIKGIMIITPNYFVANTTFDLNEDGILEANANSGPLTIENGTIKVNQWMQLHWRQDDPAENYLRVNVPEDINYTIDGNQLIFHFPTENKYISERGED